MVCSRFAASTCSRFRFVCRRKLEVTERVGVGVARGIASQSELGGRGALYTVPQILENST